MANRTFFPLQGSLDKGIVELFCQFTAGTSGAVPSTLAGLDASNGFTLPVLSGTGLYTFGLQDPFYSLADYHVEIEQATYDKTHGGMATLDHSTSDVTSGSAPQVAFQVRTTDGNGTAAALTSGDIIRVHLWLRVLKP